MDVFELGFSWTQSIFTFLTGIVIWWIQERRIKKAEAANKEIINVADTNSVYKEALAFSEKQVENLRRDYQFVIDEIEILRKSQREDRRLINSLKKELSLKK
jgi:hypothetical protein